MATGPQYSSMGGAPMFCAGATRERLGTLRMRVSDAVRMVSVIALEEYGAFSTRLKSKPKERVLAAREYGAEMALSAHRVETMAKKYKQVRTTRWAPKEPCCVSLK